MFLNEADKAFVAIQQQFLACKGVTTDTRTAGQGQLFFALKGEHSLKWLMFQLSFT